MYKIHVGNRNYAEWECFFERDMKPVNLDKLDPVSSKLLSGDVFDVEEDGKCADSSQPKFIATANLVCTVTREKPVGSLKEASECGGRGLCDHTTGICNCFKGYHGDSCSEITTYV